MIIVTTVAAVAFIFFLLKLRFYDCINLSDLFYRSAAFINGDVVRNRNERNTSELKFFYKFRSLIKNPREQTEYEFHDTLE
ncbi:hypothetical protein PUN28_011762 [Cardiocondyla obscurior]|uniref:Uncharacterized protein n=1 Tax=Cardiocondyla obscurior TaxID=286306 RepID=A0AAW2FKL6_9HYME